MPGGLRPDCFKKLNKILYSEFKGAPVFTCGQRVLSGDNSLSAPNENILNSVISPCKITAFRGQSSTRV